MVNEASVSYPPGIAVSEILLEASEHVQLSSKSTWGGMWLAHVVQHKMEMCIGKWHSK